MIAVVQTYKVLPALADVFDRAERIPLRYTFPGVEMSGTCGT